MDKRGVPREVTPVALRLPGLSTGYQTVDTVIDLQLFWSGKNSFLLFQSRLRSRYFFCVMSLMAQAFSRRRRAAPCPGYQIAQRCSPGKPSATGGFEIANPGSFSQHGE
ncbi:hypothetical protein [Klebsiella quasivariicola]|uniref:hypothetical protein n=1 Tax=Klebsiella quasivariicola TaxID=2026240 RepID=UPI00247AABD9|nr:hypothetical protein [Klebsiella quasivariicola]